MCAYDIRVWKREGRNKSGDENEVEGVRLQEKRKVNVRRGREDMNEKSTRMKGLVSWHSDPLPSTYF